VLCSVTITLQVEPSNPYSQSRRSSLTPSFRQRPPPRSSPLAGPSFSVDGVGNVVKRASALEEEIIRRHSQLIQFNDEEIISPSTPSLSPGSTNAPSSRKVSIEEPAVARRAHPSFISLGPSSTCSSLILDIPSSPQRTSQMLRARHSSPHISAPADNSDSNPAVSSPAAASWITATPIPSFSRRNVYHSSVVLPIKAASRTGEQIRRKSTAYTQPAKSTPVPITTTTHIKPETWSVRSRSLKSFRSMSRIFRGGKDQHHDKEASPVPTTRAPRLQSHRSSAASGMLYEQVKAHVPATPSGPAPVSPLTPDTPVAVGRFGPLCASPEPQTEPESSRFSLDEDSKPTSIINETDTKGEKGPEGRMKQLWAKVKGGLRRNRFELESSV
jgi:hypothetical protein